MLETTAHVYDEHQLTEDMLDSTQTVFLVDRETKHCFAYLTRWPIRMPKQEWAVWKYDTKFAAYLVIETGRTYEACLMFLGSQSAGQLLNFDVMYSDNSIPYT